MFVLNKSKKNIRNSCAFFSFFFLCSLKLYLWRLLLLLWVQEWHLFGTIVRDVSVLCVAVMDQSSTVQKPASSLSVTQSMASDEWKFTASARLSPLSLYNALLVCNGIFRHHVGVGVEKILRSLLIERSQWIWIMLLWGENLVSLIC